MTDADVLKIIYATVINIRDGWEKRPPARKETR